MNQELRAIESDTGLEGGKKPPALFGGENEVLVRTGKVGENARQDQMRAGRDRSIKLRRLFMPHPQSSHSRVDFQVDRNRTPGGAPCLFQ